MEWSETRKRRKRDRGTRNGYDMRGLRWTDILSLILLAHLRGGSRETDQMWWRMSVVLRPFLGSSLPAVTRFPRYGRSEGMEWVNDGRNEERTEWREWEETTNDHPTGHLLSVIPLPLMSVLTLPTSFLCSLSLLSRSLRLEVRFSLFTSHLSSDSEPRSGEQRRWVDRRRTDPRKLRQVVRILGLEVRLNGHEI